MRLIAILTWTLLASALGLGPVLADKRVALVIGNSAYKAASTLPNPRNDAGDVASALKRVGFETIVGLDLDKTGMEDAAIRFARAAREADVALFYFAGHAIQHGGVNYLMPTDARLTDEADLRRLTRVDEIMADLQQAKSLRILVLDSCRDNPLAEDFKRSIGLTRAVAIGRGLARIDSASGMIVSYATQPGRTAADGTGRNSPYTAAFLKHIEAAEEVGTIFRRISADVYEATKRAQLPELSLSMIGEYYFKDGPAVRAGADAVPPPSNPAAQAWAVTKDATSVAILEDFIRQFRATPYGSMARARLDELKKSQIAAVAPPVTPAAPPTSVTPAVGVFPPALEVSPLTPERERSLRPKDTFKECDVCPEMVVVPAGSFTMGSPAKEKQREKEEGPQHRVTFAKAFAAGKFSVTFAEWDACVNDGGCDSYRPDDLGWGRGSRPVIHVSWNDAKAYVAWLSRTTGRTYRLLSEAEREYVTRAGTTTPFWWGSTISTARANYDGNYTYGNGSKGEYRNRTLTVDSLQPNPFGLYQVHGNVYEWTEDCWHDSYNGAPSDGTAWTSGNCSYRVLRGGAWNLSPETLRAANRYRYAVGNRYYIFGFRVGRTLTP